MPVLVTPNLARAEMDNATEHEVLHKLVQLYRVCWEVWPEYQFVNGRRVQIGFELELSGTHAPSVEHPTPGCEHCRNVFLALIAIAERILPRERRPTRYDLEPYESSIRYSQERNFRPDVTLRIKILHREDAFLPIDDCESRCLAEMQQRLRDIGACEGRCVAKRAQQ